MLDHPTATMTVATGAKSPVVVLTVGLEATIVASFASCDMPPLHCCSFATIAPYQRVVHGVVLMHRDGIRSWRELLSLSSSHSTHPTL